MCLELRIKQLLTIYQDVHIIYFNNKSLVDMSGYVSDVIDLLL